MTGPVDLPTKKTSSHLGQVGVTLICETGGHHT